MTDKGQLRIYRQYKQVCSLAFVADNDSSLTSRNKSAW